MRKDRVDDVAHLVFRALSAPAGSRRRQRLNRLINAAAVTLTGAEHRLAQVAGVRRRGRVLRRAMGLEE